MQGYVWNAFGQMEFREKFAETKASAAPKQSSTPVQKNLVNEGSALYSEPANENQTNQLTPNEFILSSNKVFKVIYEEDGNLNEYGLFDDDDGDVTLQWSTKATLPKGTKAGSATLEKDGNIVLRNHLGAVYWKTDIKQAKGPSGPYCLQIRNSRNMIIFNSNKQQIWGNGRGFSVKDYQKHTHCTLSGPAMLNC